MEKVEELFTRLDKGDDIDGIRRDIADLIVESMNQKREEFGYWEKHQFGGAIAALGRNIAIGNKASTSSLRMCLSCIENAFTPPDERDENYVPGKPEVEALTFDLLMDDARKLGGH